MQPRTEAVPDTMAGRESLGELVRDLANQSSALVRDEIELAKKEVSEKAAILRTGVVLSLMGAWLGTVGFLALIAALIAAISPSVGVALSALIVGGALVVIAAAIAWTGLQRLRQTSLKPEQTMETLREDKRWLKELT